MTFDLQHIYNYDVLNVLDIALIHNNAKVGSQIACALSKQMNRRKLRRTTHHHGKQSESDIVSINTYAMDLLSFLVRVKTVMTMLHNI